MANRTAPKGTPTPRVGFLLKLEGDETGFLRTDGDAQSGTDALKVEGEEVAIVPVIVGS